MNRARKLMALLSAVFLILVAGLAFSHLRTGTEEYPPPILDPEFTLLFSDPNFGILGQRLMVWQGEYERGVGDTITLQEAEILEQRALELEIFIYQGGTDDKWTYVRLGQTINGTRLRALLDEDVGVWVFLPDPMSAFQFVFAIQTNDGTHTLEFLFTENAAEMKTSPAHRTIFLSTPIAQWTHHPIDLAEQYRKARWKLPDRISLSIFLGAPRSAEGWHQGCVHGFTVTKQATPELAQQQRMMTTVLSTTSPSALCAIDEFTASSREKTMTRRPDKPDMRLPQGFNG